jgi:hypothetical protein
MLELTLESKDSGRIWNEVIPKEDWEETKQKCAEYKIKILSVFDVSLPDFFA